MPAGTNQEGKRLFRIAKGKTLVANAKCEDISQDYTVSEGQGYGMVIVALMAGFDPDAQTKFDGLWLFSREFPSSIGINLMSWCVKAISPDFAGENRLFEIPQGEDNSAFDGDADIAYALLLAHKQWGSNGKINYLKEAKKILNDILKYTIGNKSHLPKLGDWVEQDCVINNTENCVSERWTQYTPRSSDFMPAHFRSFYQLTGNSEWLTIIRQSQAVIETIQNNFSVNTGLLPDFIINCNSHCAPATPFFLEAETDGDYSYNAGRAPWRIGLDALLNHNAKSKHAALKMINWLAANTDSNVDNVKAEYKLDGTAISDYSTSFFIAPFAIASMLDASHQSFLNDMYTFLYQSTRIIMKIQ
jgi:endo-1,4-beta-D-glucanase Y